MTAPDTTTTAGATFAAAPPAGAACGRRAATYWPAHARFWLIAVGGLTLDLWSKDWAFHTLRQGGRQTLIPGVLEFQTMFNPGALFGIGHGLTDLFLIASLLALALVLWMFTQSSARRWGLHIALGGIFAGALGNMYDRMFVRLVPQKVDGMVRYFDVREEAGGLALREYPPDGRGLERLLPEEFRERLPEAYGYVRDFIKIDTTVYGRELWPWVFNVADMLLVGGVAILAIQLLRERSAPSESAAAAATAGPAP
ncbi:MAG: signal peptidase II, partial [Phycisphaerae bacterium]